MRALRALLRMPKAIVRIAFRWMERTKDKRNGRLSPKASHDARTIDKLRGLMPGDRNMANVRKPRLTASQQVAHPKSEGVGFRICSERDAEVYLKRNNNYFSLKSYRANFARVEGGPNDGKYIGLDFGMLTDLSTIDMRLRNEMLPITLDVEHFAKVRLLGKMGERRADGYKIVRNFLQQQDNLGTHPYDEIDKGKSSPYTSGLVERRTDYDFPAWELIEVISFGRFIHFYKFCADKFDNRRMRNDYYMLQSVKGLRAAKRQGAPQRLCPFNCIINDLRAGTPPYAPRSEVKSALGRIGVRGDMQRTKLSNERMQQIATTLFMYSELASVGIHNARAKSLGALRRRMDRHANYYRECAPVSTSFDFIGRMVSGWYPTD